MKKDSRIFVAGHRGMVGSAIYRALKARDYTQILTRTSSELDLRMQADVKAFFASERPEYVFLAAAKVGGIQANNVYRADFLYDNLMMQSNVIHSAHVFGVKKLMFLGSSCIYPKLAPQPLKEQYLLTGVLEPTNEPYAIAKIAGIKLCENYRRQYGSDFISVMPTNLYGYGDNYDLEKSHVLPAMIRKFHEAKEASAASVEVWGTGTPLREFLFADDLAEACRFLMEEYSEESFINVGSQKEISIKDLANLVKRVIGFDGDITWNTEKPDGTPRKLMDSTRLFALGWRPKVELEDGIHMAYHDFLNKEKQVRL
ncbi:MAG: GDP-L-fucose synthase [Bacteroidota bacterium]